MPTPEITGELPAKAPDKFATEMVARASDVLRERAKRYLLAHGGMPAVQHVADVYLQRAALAFAAAKIAETGEHGTKDALTLLRQIAEGLE